MAGKIDTAAFDSFGVIFTGYVSSISDVKDWTTKDQKQVLGQKIDLQVNDGKKGFTFSYKVPTGENFKPVQIFQVVRIKVNSIMNEMGLGRLTGEFLG